MNTLLFSGFDALILLFSITVSVFIGNQFQPNPIVFLVLYGGTRLLVYKLWFDRVPKTNLSWIRLLVQTTILIIFLPFIVATSVFILPGIPDNLLWFGLIPLLGIIVSILLHKTYRLS